MSAEEKAQVLEKVESSPGSKRKVLAKLGVSKMQKLLLSQIHSVSRAPLNIAKTATPMKTAPIARPDQLFPTGGGLDVMHHY